MHCHKVCFFFKMQRVAVILESTMTTKVHISFLCRWAWAGLASVKQAVRGAYAQGNVTFVWMQ